jgi:hypothetical protein
MKRFGRRSFLRLSTTALFAERARQMLGQFSGAASLPGQTERFTHGTLRVEVESAGGRLRERYLTRISSGWDEIASGFVSVTGPGGVALEVRVQQVHSFGDRLVVDLSGDGFTIERTLRKVDNGSWIRISNRLNAVKPISLHSFSDRLRVALHPDWSYSPSVGGFTPDGKYKSPVVILQSGSKAIAVVPDVMVLDRATLQRSNHSLDLDVPEGPQIAVGFIPGVRAYHTVFKEDLDHVFMTEGPLENAYYLYASATAPPRGAYREAVRFLWAQFGQVAMRRAADLQSGTDSKYLNCHLWDEWRETVWEHESPDSWLHVRMPDGSIGGAVRMIRTLRPKPSVYLGAWFNSLRTAYGMALYARRTNSIALMDPATETLNLALKAPGVDGAFKCFAVPDDIPAKTVWGAGDGGVKSVSSGYLGFDMSWTGYWMLRWREAQLPGSEAILDRCRRLAEFLVARQRRNGMLPTRFDEAGFVETSESDIVVAESAPVIRFLFELYKNDANPRYLQAAMKGLGFLDTNVVADRKWYDFETFWSCSPRLVAFDDRTHQWPANNLALIHAVDAYLQAYEITHDGQFLAKGEALLDYLLLYQQVWTNPVLENLSSPVMLLGGFTTQNSDGEWSDARQSLAAEVILRYYRATHKPEYLERGVEALRSQFPISPSENWAHEAYGPKAGISSFHWGTGSGLAGVEMEEEFLRDAVCDVAGKRCVGVNGLNVTDWQIEGRSIRITMNSPFSWKRKPVVVFRGVHPVEEYSVIVNGHGTGSFTGKDLQTGIAVDLG